MLVSTAGTAGAVRRVQIFNQILAVSFCLTNPLFLIRVIRIIVKIFGEKQPYWNPAISDWCTRAFRRRTVLQQSIGMRPRFQLSETGSTQLFGKSTYVLH